MRFVAIAALVAFGQPADAETCLPRQKLVAALTGVFSEARTVVGLSRGGTIVEWWSSDAGTWTLTETMPSGLTCLRASGDSASLLLEASPGDKL